MSNPFHRPGNKILSAFASFERDQKLLKEVRVMLDKDGGLKPEAQRLGMQ